MTDTVFTMGGHNLSQEVPGIARAMQDYLFDDIPLGLRYSLLRLQPAGLTERDRVDLLELGRLAVSELDVTERANAILERKDASPLATAIVEVVSRARVSKRAALLGAVYGAYAFAYAAGEPDELPTRLAIIGAVAGASAHDAHAFLDSVIAQRSWSEYLAARD